ncbi:hypothetical protein [Azonexus hydrophilus]|uniref:hypothetical protein n=1 Tax=Azonexus hydrophilus TaxID=418702 RepID=UPI001966BF6D|nr:hypothetical protein [Azonexus hydrophilus]
MKTLLLAAAMPVVLMDGQAPGLERWVSLEPAVQAALECRQPLRPSALNGITPEAPGSWTLTPARSFTVFGLPVAQVRLFIDPDGELGASYTAVIEKRSADQVRKQIRLLERGKRTGQLSVGQAHGPQQVELTCTVAADD